MSRWYNWKQANRRRFNLITMSCDGMKLNDLESLELDALQRLADFHIESHAPTPTIDEMMESLSQHGASEETIALLRNELKGGE